jgi:hypothetical protein
MAKWLVFKKVVRDESEGVKILGISLQATSRLDAPDSCATVPETVRMYAMFPAPPPGWRTLHEKAQSAKTAEELSKIVAEMNAKLDEYERAFSADSRSAKNIGKHQGDHTCVFYNTEESLLDFLVPYFAEGCLKGEYCFGAQKPHVREQLFSGLRSFGIGVEEAIDRGALDIHTEDEVYFSDERFEPRAMMNKLRIAVKSAKGNGFSRIRMAGELSWARRTQNLWRETMNYEGLAHRYIADKPVISVCQYNSSICPVAARNALAQVHTSQMHLTEDVR